jgi:hypothetical protein
MACDNWSLAEKSTTQGIRDGTLLGISPHATFSWRSPQTTSNRSIVLVRFDLLATRVSRAVRLQRLYGACFRVLTMRNCRPMAAAPSAPPDLQSPVPASGGDSGSLFAPVSAIGAPGIPLASSEIVRPPAAQNPIPVQPAPQPPALQKEDPALAAQSQSVAPVFCWRREMSRPGPSPWVLLA